MSFLENNFFLLAITFGIFFFAKLLQKKTGLVLLNPILLTIALLIIFLKMTHISYETYNKGGHLIEFWLRPAVVALGVPLYLQLEMIKKQLLPILLSQLAGCIVGVISVVLIAKFMGASQEVILSLAPKSVTTPIAMEVTKAIGGIPSLTAAVVVAVGLLGAICGFKTMKISVNIVVPLSIETASENALVGGLLVRSCKKYPDFTVLSKKLSSLYGADLTSSLSKLGESQVLKISVSGLDDRYSLDDVSIAKELSELLCSVIFEPNVKDNAFIESELEQERRQLLDVIDSEFNEKRIYAMEQLIKHMCKDEVFGTKRYGTAEKIKAATAESLYRAWQNLLKTAKFEILYIGDSPADKAKEVFTKAFANIERNVAASSTDVVKNVSEEKHITEEMELSQSKLVMGFRTQISAGDDEAVAERLICAVLGGTASSKLFNKVRAKQSL